MKHFSLYLPDDVHEQLRVRAFEERRSMNQIVGAVLVGAAPPLARAGTQRPASPKPTRKPVR